MKKLIAIGALAALAACSTTGQVKVATSQQLVNSFCPIVTTDVQVLSQSPLLNADQQAKAKEIGTVTASVCTASASVNLADLQTLDQTAFPALITLIMSIPNFPHQQEILLALTLAQPILTEAVQMATTQATVAAQSK